MASWSSSSLLPSFKPRISWMSQLFLHLSYMCSSCIFHITGHLIFICPIHVSEKYSWAEHLVEVHCCISISNSCYGSTIWSLRWTSKVVVNCITESATQTWALSLSNFTISSSLLSLSLLWAPSSTSTNNFIARKRSWPTSTNSCIFVKSESRIFHATKGIIWVRNMLIKINSP